jgi:hypothetical protein
LIGRSVGFADQRGAALIRNYEFVSPDLLRDFPSLRMNCPREQVIGSEAARETSALLFMD